MPYYCNYCKKTISLKVYNYSKNKFGRALCIRHQGRSRSKESDFGDLFQKCSNATATLHKAGGIGLTLTGGSLIIFGILAFFRVEFITEVKVGLSVAFVTGVFFLIKQS